MVATSTVATLSVSLPKALFTIRSTDWSSGSFVAVVKSCRTNAIILACATGLLAGSATCAIMALASKPAELRTGNANAVDKVRGPGTAGRGLEAAGACAEEFPSRLMGPTPPPR